MKRIGRTRRKTRAKFSKGRKEKGKVSLTKYFQTFKDGEGVILSVEPAVQKGMYDRKFVGITGKIIKKTGKCYEVSIMDKKKEKTLLVHPVHLKRLK